MWWIPLATAGVGLLQAKMQNDAMQKAQAQQNRINAYSPLLGTTPQALQPYSAESSLLGGAMGGALSGMSQLQNYQQNELMNKLLERQAGGGNVVIPSSDAFAQKPNFYGYMQP